MSKPPARVPLPMAFDTTPRPFNAAVEGEGVNSRVAVELATSDIDQQPGPQGGPVLLIGLTRAQDLSRTIARAVRYANRILPPDIVVRRTRDALIGALVTGGASSSGVARHRSEVATFLHQVADQIASTNVDDVEVSWDGRELRATVIVRGERLSFGRRIDDLGDNTDPEEG